MTACPIHQTRLLSICPQCEARLTRYRPGMLECRCGATLDSVDLPPISLQEASLLDLVRRKVLGLDLSADNSSALPAVQLYALELRPLLTLIWTLGKHRLIVLDYSSPYAPSNITAAAGHVLADWPNNFFDLLRGIGEKRPKKNRKGGVRAQFESIYSGLFLNAAIKPRQCTDFLKTAFLEFAKNHWDQGYVDRTLMKNLSPGVKGRFLTQTEFAREFGMSTSTAASLVRRNRVTAKRIRCGSQERILIDINQSGIPRNHKGRIYRLKKAAALIGLPRRVLYGLKRGGQFEAKHSGVKAGYHELDLRTLEQKLLALAPPSNGKISADGCITLGKIFSGHHGAPSGRINIVRGMLSRELTVVGNVNGTIGGLAIPLDEYKAFAQNDRARANGNMRTPDEVAAELHCERDVVPGLLERGLLRGKQIPVGLRITEQSMAAFKQRYVSLASIAADLGSSSRALMRYCAANKISVLNVQSTRIGKTQPFVRIGCREELLKFRAQRSLKKTVVLIGLPIAVLRSLKKSGHFEVRHVTRKGFHELDIAAFIRKLLALNPSSDRTTVSLDEYITLAEAMNKRYGSPEGRPNLVRSLLAGEMPVVGNLDGTIGGLLIPHDRFRRFIQNEATRTIHSWGSCCQAALSLGCERRFVPGLIKLGLLHGERAGTGFNIAEASILAFKKMYVSVGSLARELNSNSKGLMGYCRRNGIPLLTVGSRAGDRGQSFICTKDKQFITTHYKVALSSDLRKSPMHVSLQFGAAAGSDDLSESLPR